MNGELTSCYSNTTTRKPNKGHRLETQGILRPPGASSTLLMRVVNKQSYSTYLFNDLGNDSSSDSPPTLAHVESETSLHRDRRDELHI